MKCHGSFQNLRQIYYPGTKETSSLWRIFWLFFLQKYESVQENVKGCGYLIFFVYFYTQIRKRIMKRMYAFSRLALPAILFLSLVFWIQSPAEAQRRNSAYLQYIKKYEDLAVDQMKEYHIPASIKLAQGLLESGAGRSELARSSNNHFGIKCGRAWKGRSVRRTDDAPNECFRAYRHPEESYRDHSRFLRDNPRYAALFRLDMTDYKGWAHGLKRAGYATDPSYANRLITIIETYELYRYDSSSKKKRKKSGKQKEELRPAHVTYLSNGLVYVIARRGDTFDDLSDEFDISKRKLRKYNDLHKGYNLAEGDIIYLHEKHKRSPQYERHTVRPGDSMHTISQIYGVRLKSLYDLNGLDPDDYVPCVGDVLFLK